MELILSALLAKAAALLFAAEMCLYALPEACLFSFLYLLLCLKYIILLLLLTKKAGLPRCRTLPGVQKLNIAFKSQFPRWDYANQPLRVSPLCFHSSLIHPPPP